MVITFAAIKKCVYVFFWGENTPYIHFLAKIIFARIKISSEYQVQGYIKCSLIIDSQFRTSSMPNALLTQSGNKCFDQSSIAPMYFLKEHYKNFDSCL